MPQTRYIEELDRTFCALFANNSVQDDSFRVALITALQRCFQILDPKLDDVQKATLILEALFSHLPGDLEPFSFSQFLKQHIPKKAEIKALLIELFYGLYYGDIDLRKVNIGFLLIQIVATTSSKNTRRFILRNLSLDKKVRLICFLYKHYREGSYLILNELEGSKPLRSLIFWLRRNYFDNEKLHSLLQGEDEINLDAIIRQLESHAHKQTEEFYTVFNELVPLFFNSLMQVYDEAEKQLKAAGSEQLEPIKRQQEQYRQCFTRYLAHRYNLKDFETFARLFGLRAYPPIFAEQAGEIDLLVAKLAALQKVLRESKRLFFLQPKEVYQYLSFVLSIVLHLEASIHNPLRYKEGLDRFTTTMATCGKILENEPTLTTLIQGYRTLTDPLTDLKHYPIIIFDQSERSIFIKNQRYINGLNRLHKCAIIHISKEETLELAKKIGVEGLVNTAKNGSFGYGGARNAEFLLTGVLSSAFREGKRSLDEVLQMDKACLLSFFHQAVLSRSSQSLFLVDDDMEISETSIQTCALIASEFADEYIACSGFQYGRGTKFRLRYWDLKELLDISANSRVFPKWLDFPIPTGMSETFCKPKICLNIPHGNEEGHFLMGGKNHLFLQPSRHLCGTRYPTLEIPTRFFIGLDAYLEKSIPYALQIGMIDSLVDPTGKQGFSVLPWNDMPLNRSFSSLGALFTFIADDEQKTEMQRRFQKKLEIFFQQKPTGNDKFQQAIQKLIELDVDASIKAFQEREELNWHEKKALEKIQELYNFFQQDAKLFWKFGTSLAESRDLASSIEKMKEMIESEISKYPVTNGFYQLACSIGKAEFCELVAHASI